MSRFARKSAMGALRTTDRLKAIEDQLKAKAGGLGDKARLGWDPTYWLSDKRAKAEEHLKKHRKKVANQIEKVETAAKNLDSKSRDVKQS